MNIRSRPAALSMIAGAFALLSMPAPVPAATVTGTSTFQREGKSANGGYWTFDVRVVAAPGERNDVVAAAAGWDTAEIEDRGAPLLAGPGCEQRGLQRVACREPIAAQRGFARISAELGDGDDAIVLTDGGSADGGPGNDTLAVTGALSANLAGGDGDDVLTGGVHSDHLNGGNGNDRLTGGDGNDSFDQGTAPDGDDVIDGGAGPFDTVSYSSRSSSVTASLTAETAGARGETDTLLRIENVDGGHAADTLIGDDRRNFLRGGCCEAPEPGDRIDGRGGSDILDGSPGNDRISGGRGADSIDSGRGADRVDGGAGNDSIDLTFAADGRHRIACGHGTDVVDTPRPADRITTGCEQILLGSGTLESAGIVVERASLAAGARRIIVRVAIRYRGEQRPRGRIVVAATHGTRRVAVATLPFRLVPGRAWTLRAAVPARVARLVGRRRGWLLAYRFQTRGTRERSWSTHGGFSRGAN